jgi:hypothetical protein
MLPVLSSAGILDVGLSNQIRAGRQLSPADFAAIGLNAPIGLWNLSDLSDASGNGRALSNKGAVPFAGGINGTANTSAQFSGLSTQVLYISDTGAADSLRIRSGSIACWFKGAKRGTTLSVVSKSSVANNSYSYHIQILPSNIVNIAIYDGATTAIGAAPGVSDVMDDRWHFVIGVIDAGIVRIYVDGVLEGIGNISGSGFMGAANAPFNIGGYSGDGSASSAQSFFGRVDEVFVTADVLSDDQVRNLYCAKIAHTLGVVPARVSLNARRCKKGVAFVPSDFLTQPLRLHNFSAGSLGDQGSNNQTLVSNPGTGSIIPVAGADGSSGNALNFSGAHLGLSATDTGLPAGVAVRSYGFWFKTNGVAAASVVFGGWGANFAACCYMSGGSAGTLICTNVGDSIGGPPLADGQWHFVTVVEDNGAIDGIKRKFYVDGRLVGSSTVLNAITLGGANRFRIGAHTDGTTPHGGPMDGVFVCDYALTADQIHSLYAKGSQILSPSPKNVGDHVEGMDAANLYATFDTLESQHQIDLAVA